MSGLSKKKIATALIRNRVQEYKSTLMDDRSDLFRNYFPFNQWPPGLEVALFQDRRGDSHPNGREINCSLN